MKCCHCHKEINGEDYELFGMDGDFIHKKCKPAIEKEMDKIVNFSNEEFKNWLINS